MPQSKSPSLMDVLNESEAALIQEGLTALRAIKEEAMAKLNEELPPGGKKFTPHDFGIPQIDALKKRIDDAEDAEDDN